MAGGVGGSASTLGSLKVSARALEAPGNVWRPPRRSGPFKSLRHNEDRNSQYFGLMAFSGFAILAQALCLSQVANPAVGCCSLGLRASRSFFIMAQYNHHGAHRRERPMG